MVPLVTSSVGDSAVIIHFQEAYARLFSNCYNKHGIQSNLPSYRPMNQGTICAKVDLEGVQPVKGNNCGLIPPSVTYTDLRILHRTLVSFLHRVTSHQTVFAGEINSCLIYNITLRLG